MPNIKSAKKRVLVSEKKALQNKTVKTNLKTVLKKPMPPLPPVLPTAPKQ